MKFYNVNPTKLLQEFSSEGIKTINGIKSNLKEGNYIAEESWCEFENSTDINKINEIVKNHNPVIEKTPTQQEILNSQLLQQNAQMQVQLEQQKQLNAQILLKLAGGNTNV